MNSELTCACEFEAVARAKEIAMALNKLTFFNSALRRARG